MTERQEEEKHKRLEKEISACADCHGDGFSNGAKCPVCGGRGITLSVGDRAQYFFGRELLGRSSTIRSLHLFFDKLAQFLAYLLAAGALLLGLLFILSSNGDFFLLFERDAASIDPAASIPLQAYMLFHFFLLRLIAAFSVIFDRKGWEPFVFWSGSIGAMYFYFRRCTENASRRAINILDKRFKPFYDEAAEALPRPLDISVYASARTVQLLERALDLANDLGQAPAAAHVARSLFGGGASMNKLLERLEIDRDPLLTYLDQALSCLPQNDRYRRTGLWQVTVMSPELKELTILALEESLIADFDRIEPESLFLALLHSELLATYFTDRKLELADVRSAVLWSKRWGQYRARIDRPRKIEHSIMNKAWTARVTPELDQFSYDLTDYARSGLTGVVVDRTRELDSLMRILERTSQNNALLIGEQGCGRTTVVKALANRMIHDDVLPTLKDKRLVVLDIGAMVAGVRGGGDLELRLRRIMEDMGKGGNIILYIPNIHNMAAAGSDAGYDASKILAPILGQGLFQIIGSTDYRNYHRYIEPRSDFANNFDMVKVEELGEEDTLKVLAIQAAVIEAREGITMSYGAIKKAVELSKRYIPDRLLPGKAIDLLSETAVEVRRRGAGEVLRGADVMELITEKTGIPLTNINSSEAEKLLHLEEKLHERVIGQDQAISSIASSIRRVRVGMKKENRPIGTFLFLGPTGVGKTELAKALAEVYYGDENAMIRLDMSEYQTPNSAEKLIGYSAAASEDGGGAGGVLTEAVKRKPFSLILLDELEKANRNVLNIFLQVFDDGRLTDNSGRTVDFTNTIIIATSNAGSEVAGKMSMGGEESSARIFELMEPYLLQSFAPEFLNRFTDKIIFRSISPEDLLAIARLQVEQLAERLDKAQGIRIRITDDAISYLAERGYSAEYGARFLQRTLQEKLENLIAVEFLKGKIKRGDTFTVSAQDLINSK
jgi:ATP-dependent Clp protease ATP-binding subunit ClpC